MGVYVGEVTRRKDGKIGLAAFKAEISQGIGAANFGGWQEGDIGKRVYRVGSVYQMESNDQRNARIMEARAAVIRYGIG